MLTRPAITHALIEAGLKPGDSLIVHSSLRRLGPVDGGADAVIDALLDAVGPDGTLAMPSFNYVGHIPQPYYDVRETPGRTGVLTEVFRRRPGTVRSIHPTHAMIAQGPRAAELMAYDPAVRAVGPGSPIDRLTRAGAYVLLLGTTHESNTTVHLGEEYAGVRKFFWWDGPLPAARIRLLDGSFIEHRLDTSTSCSLAFNAVDHPLRVNGQVRDFMVGEAISHLVRASDVVEAVIGLVRETPDVLFCTNPNCRPCRLGRAFLAGEPVPEV